MTFRGKVVMLTGAAGTGKSSLSREAGGRIRPLHRVDYGQLLLNRKIGLGNPSLTYEELRTQSASLITPEDVEAADAELIDSLPGLREKTHVLIDSHAVTRESYGFRITHYTLKDLKRIALDGVIVTYCSPTELVKRHKRNPQGRPSISETEASHHMALQEAVAVHYAIVCGCRCFLLDTTTRSPSGLAEELKAIFGSSGSVA